MNLLTAAESGDLDRVQLLLLSQGFDKDMADSSGDTALIKAAAKGHLSVVKFLVEQGADMNTPLMTPLMTASVSGHQEVVRYLLEQGADRDKANNGGWTALHFAAIFGYLEIALLIMSYGANLNARTNDGNLPIDVGLTEEIRQAIRDEPRRRMDHGHKRATDQDRHTNAAASANAQQEDEEQEEEEQSNKKPRLGEGEVTEEEAKVLAEINEDSEPSDQEDD